MRLDTELVKRGMCESRKEAEDIIAEGGVTVNGQLVTKKSKNVNEGDDLLLLKKRPYVSRGGEKIEGVFLKQYGSKEGIINKLTGRIALDIGSSTGGFTHFLLEHGVSHVDCVDVGTLQLHEKIREDDRVSVYENTDIREFNPVELYDVVVADLSFISLKKILELALSFGKEDSIFIFLIKPQFEVGKGNLKKGIVKDETLVEEVLQEYKKIMEKNGAKELSITPSLLKGGDGNQEYFIFCIK